MAGPPPATPDCVAARALPCIIGIAAPPPLPRARAGSLAQPRRAPNAPSLATRGHPAVLRGCCAPRAGRHAVAGPGQTARPLRSRPQKQPRERQGTEGVRPTQVPHVRCMARQYKCGLRSIWTSMKSGTKLNHPEYHFQSKRI